MDLKLLENEYAVYKFPVNYEIEKTIYGNDFVSVTKTEDELSIVAVSGSLDHFTEKEDGWRILKINEILDFSLTGILSKISAVLAGSKISIFALSTYNTDYIMIKNNRLDEAIKVLEKNNYGISGK